MCNTDKCCRARQESISSIKKEGRQCTDLLFLIGFFAFWGISFAIVSWAKANGADPDKIIRGVDMRGRICGRPDWNTDPDGGVGHLPLTAWPHPQYYDAKICVEYCNATMDYKNEQMARLYPTKKFLGYCLPDPLANISLSISIEGQLTGAFAGLQQQAKRAVADLNTAQWVIVGSSFLAIAVTFMFTFIIKKFASCLIWFLFALIVLGGVIMGLMLLQQSQMILTSNPQHAEFMQIAAYIVFALCVILVLIAIALYVQLQIAIEVVREAAHAIIDMPMIIFFPMIPFFLLFAYLFYWIYGAIMVMSITENVYMATPDKLLELGPEFAIMAASAGDLAWLAAMPDTTSLPTNMTRLDTRGDVEAVVAVHLFHLLWTNQLLYYWGFLVFAGCTADWYFTETDDKGRKLRGAGEGALGHWPICSSMCRSTRFHMGTVSVAAFIIAVVQMIRIMIKYLERKTKGDPPNPLQKAMFAAIQCCLKCLQCCLDKINRNALIWTAVYGDGFGTAACSSFALIWRNLDRVAAITLVSGIILFITKIAVGLATAGVGAMLITVVYGDEVSSVLTSAVLMFIVGYVVSLYFLDIFNATIDTTFFCFLIDYECNAKGEMMCTDALAKLVGKYEKRSKKVAARLRKQEAARMAKNEGGVMRTIVDLEDSDLRASRDEIELQASENPATTAKDKVEMESL